MTNPTQQQITDLVEAAKYNVWSHKHEAPMDAHELAHNETILAMHERMEELQSLQYEFKRMALWLRRYMMLAGHDESMCKVNDILLESGLMTLEGLTEQTEEDYESLGIIRPMPVEAMPYIEEPYCG